MFSDRTAPKCAFSTLLRKPLSQNEGATKEVVTGARTKKFHGVFPGSCFPSSDQSGEKVPEILASAMLKQYHLSEKTGLGESSQM